MNPFKQKIGIIGGGQLGKMMILEAKKMGFTVVILDPTPDCPAHSIADGHIVANFYDQAAIRELAAQTDVLTYELEHIDTGVLLELAQEGHPVYPTPGSLRIIQNKLSQKETLQKSGLPVPEFMAVQDVADIEAAGETFGYPFMLKACTQGYDGKGNALVKSQEEIAAAFTALKGGEVPLMAEKFVPFEKEISVLSCRGKDGDVRVYPVAENRHQDSILHETRVPAAVAPAAFEKAMALAKETMAVFEGVGMFCVEMFVTKDGDVLINEIAPRPHNSGHYTIEACAVSQFEQHIRAIAGLPLGSAQLLTPVVMRNLLGDNPPGEATTYGAEKALAIPGITLHLYGKQKVAYGRKMGHLTAIASTVEEAARNAQNAWENLVIKGE